MGQKNMFFGDTFMYFSADRTRLTQNLLSKGGVNLKKNIFHCVELGTFRVQLESSKILWLGSSCQRSRESEYFKSWLCIISRNLDDGEIVI